MESPSDLNNKRTYVAFVSTLHLLDSCRGAVSRIAVAATGLSALIL
jgi:hypothetical protein